MLFRSLTFIVINLFDTMGTVIGCCKNAGLTDEDGKPEDYDKIMAADSIATVCGSVIGTPTVTTFVESGVGIASGGKSGLTALVIAGLFFLSIFLIPLFAFIPPAAAASALIYVGVLMIANVKDIDFSNPRNSVPAFLTIIMMPLTCSITNGIGIGIVVFFIINIITYLLERFQGKKDASLDVTFVTFIITLLFLIYFVVPV